MSRGKKPKTAETIDLQGKDASEKLVIKLNELSLDLLEELATRRTKRDTEDMDLFKLSLLTIKELKDWCKVLEKIKSGTFGSYFENNFSPGGTIDDIETELEKEVLGDVEEA